MGSLTFVGLGLGPKGVSLEGLVELRTADEVFLEYYTTPHDPALVGELERQSGRHLTIVDRAFVEDGRSLLAAAKSRKVVLAVPGDPMIATTHAELRVRAIRAGIEARVVHGVTIASAAASASGLHSYKFSRTVTITRESVKRLSQAYQILHENLLEGAHTLLLLEFDVERGEGVTPNEAIRGLLAAEADFKRAVVSTSCFALVLSRVGRVDASSRAGTLAELEGFDYLQPPHSVIIPGKLHFTEVESIAAIFSLDAAKIHGNSESVKRTAETLVPRYVEKTKKALASVRSKLGPEYDSVVENAELYIKDAESFLLKGDDELAMLSVGYAEGLLDSLNFAGVVKIDW
ncbi:MAG: diphthine synthase [Nitrososphaerales archaeon]|nr:diphthine synthase [Nitrososphaerales archaeon]